MSNENDSTSAFTNGLVSLSDVAKTFLFQLEIQAESGTSLANLINSYDDVFRMRARTANIPAKSFEMLSENYMGTMIEWVGKATVSGDMTVTFDEHQDLSISKFLHAWQSLMFDNNTTSDEDDVSSSFDQVHGGASNNYFKDYSATITVHLYDSTKKKRLPYGWKLLRCVPTSVDQVSLSYDDSSKVQRNVTFHYQMFVMIDEDD